MVARGTPPSSRPPRTSVLLGMSGINASATARNNTGSDSKRYLSKYSVAVLPERRRNVPRTYADRRIAAARADLFTSSWRGADCKSSQMEDYHREKAPPDSGEY